MDGTELIKVEKLQKDEEWPQWKFQIRIILQASDLIDIVTGKVKKPVQTEGGKPEDFAAALEKFNKSDFKAQRIIVTSLGKEPMLHVMNCTSACEMWHILELCYEKKSKVTVQLVYEQFFNFKMESGDSMAVHISKLQSIVQKLKDLGETVSNDMLFTRILSSLSMEFNHFHSAWESTAEDQQTLENLTSRLMMEETRMAKQNQNEVSEAFVAEGTERSQKCFRCNGTGIFKSKMKGDPL